MHVDAAKALGRAAGAGQDIPSGAGEIVAGTAQRVRSAATLGILFMLASTLASSSLHVGVRYISGHLPVLQIVFVRAAMTFLMTAPFVFRPGQMAWRTNAPGLQMLRGVVGTCSMTAWYYALAALPLADAATMGLTTSLFVVLGAMLFFRERVGAFRMVALLTGFAGALFVIKPTGQNVNLVPALIALASSAIWATSLLMAKALAKYDSSITITFYQPLTMLPWVAIGGILVWQTPTLHDWLVLAAMSACAGIGNYCTIHALRLTDASIAMPVDYTKLLWTVAAAYVLFSEIPGVSTLTGAALIIAASLAIAIREGRRPPTDAPAGPQATKPVPSA
jgi:drug/metabolite transporter (DMT)-like permease